MKIHLFAASSLLAFTSYAKVYYEKQLVFPAEADSATKIEMAANLIPTEKQLAWQDLELTAFIHFGINTFTDREWGDGAESPSIFNPDNLDADQWVTTLKNAGLKMVILTAKHHDGFCLWPTATTDHSVAASPWRNGQGDVVADLAEACRRHGMKLGIYLSPWDRNAQCYGDSPRYNDMFVAQLTELLSNYGTIDEVWFDGACGEGPNGKKQEYDWTRFKKTMETLQPGAVLAIMGDDVRWVGNEAGLGRETEWSVTALAPEIYENAISNNQTLDLDAKSPDLGGRSIVAKARTLYWWPSEVDVSIRPGWFWHASEKPKSLRQLADIYINSVGRNSTLLLNVPPDRHGRIAPADSIRLAELGRWISDNFSTPKSSGIVNCIVLSEDIAHGQRIESFNIIANDSVIASGTTIGHKRILTFEPVEASDVSVEITSSRAEPLLLSSNLYFITMPEEEKDDANDLLPCDLYKTSDDGFTVSFSNPIVYSGLVYYPDPDEPVTHYFIEVSDNGSDWEQLTAVAEFSNIVNNPIKQTVRFKQPINKQYIRLVPCTAGKGHITLLK